MLTAVVGSIGLAVCAIPGCAASARSTPIDDTPSAIGEAFEKRKLSKLMNGNVIRNQVREGKNRACAIPKFYHRPPERSGIYGKMPCSSNPAHRSSRRPAALARRTFAHSHACPKHAPPPLP
ncbi:hypothetical protein [Caballeronia grimmiae]|uniref:hypothetical protein n=1 Tax=Caballeronia grimmiae TaxID=1071679 RepID=UPI0038B8A786